MKKAMKARFSRWFLPGIGAGALAMIGSDSPVFAADSATSQPPLILSGAGEMNVSTNDALPSGTVVATSELPANIAPTSPLAQVVRMAQAGVDESVLMSCITNSTGTFNLDADRIIYLRDIGVPNDIVTAMLQRDQSLQQQMTATATEQATQTETQPAATNPLPTAETQPTEPTEPVTINDFNDNLSPYGSWVYVTGYGRCWRPSVAVYNAGWQPYCYGGHWVYTDCGWYWQSDYAWGATFHYGRWFRDARIGWCWWPDTVWSPSWVTWRYSANYCGWAPLPPYTAFGAGGFVYRGSAVSVGFSFGLDAGYYTFVATRDFCNPHPGRYRIAANQTQVIYNETTVINNININRGGHRQIIVNNGIAPHDIENVTHQPIRPVPVNQFNGHRDGRNFPSYRPVANNGNNFPNRNPSPNNNRPAPQSTIPVISHNPLDRPNNNNNSGRTSPYTVYQSPRPVPDHNNNQSDQTTVTPRWRQFEQQNPHLTGPTTPSEPRAPITTPIPQQRPAENYRPQPFTPSQTPHFNPPPSQPRNNPQRSEVTRPSFPQRQLADDQPARNSFGNAGNPNRASGPDRNQNRPGH